MGLIPCILAPRGIGTMAAIMISGRLLGRADTRLLILIREKKAKEDPDKLEQELASVIE